MEKHLSSWLKMLCFGHKDISQPKSGAIFLILLYEILKKVFVLTYVFSFDNVSVSLQLLSFFFQ